MSLYTQRFNAVQKESTIELVLIHGWGVSSVIWTHWLTTVKQYCNVTLIDLPGYGYSDYDSNCYENLESLSQLCVDKLPNQAIYIGFSLGGMLALNIAKYFPDRVQAVITIASNIQFVAGKQWPQAMPKSDFDAFYAAVERDSQQAVKRFRSLQVKGAVNERALLKEQKNIVDNSSPSANTLIQSLQCLARINNLSLIENIKIPTLHLMGENDQLVPIGVAEILKNSFDIDVVVIANAPHTVFISDPENSWSSICQFLRSQKLMPQLLTKRLDKKQVARSFSRAASTYDGVADLQRKVGATLCSYLPRMSENQLSKKTFQSPVILDLGCGTGFFSSSLKKLYPTGQLVGVDLAEGMIQAASASYNSNSSAWLCGDAENIPLQSNSIDIIFSSLAIQWCEDTDALFRSVERVLKPGGLFVVSTLGPNTLFELRDAWRRVDQFVHVNRFIEQERLRESAQHAGLVNTLDTLSDTTADIKSVDSKEIDEKECFKEQIITLEYSTLKSLTRELKSLGAHNVNQGRPSGLTGKKRINALIDAYDKQRNEKNLLPASYQVWYGRWKKPSKSKSN